MQMRTTALRQEVEAEEVFDTHPEVRLDFKHVQAALKKGYTKPFLLVDSNIVRNKARRFKAAMPRVQSPLCSQGQSRSARTQDTDRGRRRV